MKFAPATFCNYRFSVSSNRITFGSELYKTQVRGFTLTETLHAPNFRLAKHGHKNPNFNFVIEGSLLETVGDLRRYADDYGRHAVIYKPGGQIHSNIYGSGGARCLVLELTDEWNDEALRDTRSLASRELIPLFLKLYAEMKSPDPAGAMILEGAALEILGHALRFGPKMFSLAEPYWLKQFIARLHDCFYQPLVIADIAAELNVHPVHLHKTFKKHKGCSPGFYLRKLRVEFAKGKLLDSNARISSIAQAAGFYDQSHFGRVFKQFYGLTPEKYRQGAKGKLFTAEDAE